MESGKGMIKSPLNYTGGKYKLLPQIMPHFPSHVDNFVDLFAGGLNVGINATADTIYVNDLDERLIEVYEWMNYWPTDTVIEVVERLIEHYGLNMTDPAPYLRLREDYNNHPEPQLLLLLIFYSFNHQMRFNSKGGFNMPFGTNRSQYNPTIKRNLIEFCDKFHSGNFVFSSGSFACFDTTILTKDSFVYCDPPYLLGNATYNEQGGWSHELDEHLRAWLDNRNYNGVKFALSNVIKHKGEINEDLIDWAKEEEYNIIPLDMTYRNCSYHLRDRNSETIEVLITNY